MFGINIFELLIILVAIVVFVKPEEMPAFFRKLGKLYAELQHYIRRMRSYSAQSLDQWSRETSVDLRPGEPTTPPATPKPRPEEQPTRDGLTIPRQTNQTPVTPPPTDDQKKSP